MSADGQSFAGSSTDTLSWSAGSGSRSNAILRFPTSSSGVEEVLLLSPGYNECVDDVLKLVAQARPPVVGQGFLLFFTGLALSSIQTGAWSLVCSQPRTCLSTSALLNLSAASELSRKWSIRSPASRAKAFLK